MWRFIVLLPRDEVQIILVGGRDLEHAFQQFARDYWHEGMTSAIGIWRNAALEGRILPGSNEAGEVVPILQRWPP